MREFLPPEATGVYIMRSGQGRVLYVGKAVNLRSRVGQYLRLQDSRAMVPRLVAETADIETIVTGTEKEALLLERQLVRRLHPKYNVLLRDDKSFLLVRVDFAHPFPRFETVRRRGRDRASYFGPYPAAGSLRDVLRFLSRTFRLRTCADRQLGQRRRPCVFHPMGWCSAPCTDPEGNSDYADRLREAVDLLTRRRQEARQRIRAFMLQASDEERFEDAAKYRDLLESLDDLCGRQPVEFRLPDRADVFGRCHGPLGGAVYVLHVRDGAVMGGSSFFNEAWFSPDIVDIESVACQYYERQPPPPLVLGAFAEDRTAAAAALLADDHGVRVRLKHPVRGAGRALLDMAAANARQAYERECERTSSRHEMLEELAAALSLPCPPEVVECVDISSFQGGDAVGAVSVAREGILAPREYRSFHIRTAAADDFSMMAEVVRRRLEQTAGSPETRLLLLDGGQGHLGRILPLAAARAPGVLLAAMAKARPADGIPSDRVFVPGRDEPVDLAPDSRILLFLASLRDEAHRFGLDFHRKTRGRRVLSSPLLRVPGIGKKRRLALVRHFGSMAAVRAASLEELLAVPGLPAPAARAVWEWAQEKQG